MPCSSPRGHRCATAGYQGSRKKALVDHISGLWALGFGAGVVDILDGEIELVLVALGAAELGPPIGQHPRQPDAVLV